MSTIPVAEIKSKDFIENASIEWQQMAEGVKRKIMAWDEKLMLVRVEFEKGGIGTLHQHYHVQITSVESGVFEVEIDNAKKIVKAGDVFYVAPNLWHGAVCLEAGVLIDVFSPMREDFFQ
ncbi:MAG: cupin domain-containing protein [Bacteroidota bacterium]|nr:cupin domain-containing protein [Bacteroidota bacterium]